MLVHLAAEPGRRASIRDIARALAFHPAIVERWADELCAHGLLVLDRADDTLRLSTSDRDRSALAGRVARAYRTRRVAVVERIIAKAVRDDG